MLPRTPQGRPASAGRLGRLRCLLLPVALAVSAAGCAGSKAPPPSHPSPLQASAAPQIDKNTLGGARIDTDAMRGQVLVVKFFAKYCEPCKETLPAAQRLHAKYEDVTFLGISVDERSSDAEALVAQYGLTFPVVLDRSRSISGRYRVVDIPMTFVVDREGVVQWVAGPGQSEEDLQRAIESLR